MRHICICIGFALSVVFIRECTLLPDGKMHLIAFDIGQGDSIFLITPSGTQVLIDGGPDQTTLSALKRVMPFFDRSIDLVVLSHPDADHITALPEVLKRYDVGSVLMTNVDHTSGRYNAFRSHIEALSIPVMYPHPDIDIDLGDGVVLDVIWPTQGYAGSSNDQSIVMRVLYKEHRILLAGDIEEEAEMEILASGADISAQVLKVAHHGSRTSTSTGFLIAVNPEQAIISAGRDNRFGHPHREVVDRLEGLGVSVRSTQSGSIPLVFGN